MVFQVPEEELEACPLPEWVFLLVTVEEDFAVWETDVPGSCLGGKSTCQERTGQAKACCKSFEIFLFHRFLLFGSFTIIIYYMRSEL